MVNSYETLRPSRRDTAVIKSASGPSSRIPRERPLEKLTFRSSTYFLEVKYDKYGNECPVKDENTHPVVILELIGKN